MKHGTLMVCDYEVRWQMDDQGKVVLLEGLPEIPGFMGCTPLARQQMADQVVAYLHAEHGKDSHECSG